MKHLVIALILSIIANVANAECSGARCVVNTKTGEQTCTTGQCTTGHCTIDQNGTFKGIEYKEFAVRFGDTEKIKDSNSLHVLYFNKKPGLRTGDLDALYRLVYLQVAVKEIAECTSEDDFKYYNAEDLTIIICEDGKEIKRYNNATPDDKDLADFIRSRMKSKKSKK